MISIETIKNGWVVIDEHGNKESFTTMQDLFDSLLLTLDGKSEHFGGSMYGKVRVDFKEPKRKEP